MGGLIGRGCLSEVPVRRLVIPIAYFTIGIFDYSLWIGCIKPKLETSTHAIGNTSGMTTTLTTIGKNICPNGKRASSGDLDGTTTGTPLGHPSATPTGTGEQGIDIDISIGTSCDRMATVVIGSATWFGAGTGTTIASTTCCVSTNKTR